MNEEILKQIPRWKTERVQSIINDENLDNREKAKMIHNFDYNQSCLEHDGHLPKLKSEIEIFDILEQL